MANRFLVTGGSGLWTGTNNWSTTSGGGSGAAAPVNGDAVTFDTNSGASPITLDTAAQACTSLAITSGYTGTMTFTNTLTVNGSITLGANMAFAGAAALICGATGTLTSAGKTLGVPLKFAAAAATLTLADSWTVPSMETFGTTQNTTLNGNTMNCTGGITMANTTGSILGTTVLNMTGSGTISQPAITSGRIGNPLTINTAGTITLSGTVRYGGNTLTRTAGTVTTTGATLAIAANLTTITNNASGLTFETLAVAQGATQTFNGSNGFTMGTLNLQANVGIVFLSGNTYTVTSTLKGTGTDITHATLSASTPSSSAFLNVSGSTIALSCVDATDIDSSGGNAIYTYNGILLRTVNWTTGSVINGASSGGGAILSRVQAGM